MTGAAATVRAARALASPGDVVALVSRPRGVAHLYVGPVSPSGGFVPRTRRAVCCARTRQLAVLPEQSLLVCESSHRLCARCSARLSAAVGRAEQLPVTRDQWTTAYAAVTVSDLLIATVLATTVGETHRLGFLAQLLHGAAPVRRNLARTPELEALFDLHAAITTRRRQLTAAARTDEDIAADRRVREAKAYDDGLVRKARRDDVRQARLQERRREGLYIAPWERPA